MGHQTQTLLQFRPICIPGLNRERGKGWEFLLTLHVNGNCDPTDICNNSDPRLKKKKSTDVTSARLKAHLELPNAFTSVFSQDSCNNTGREQMRKLGSKRLSDARNYKLQTTDLQKIILSFLSSALCPLFIRYGLRTLKGKVSCLPNV